MAKNLQKKTIILMAGIFDLQWELKPIVNLIEQNGYSCVIFRFKSWGRESYFSVEKKLEKSIKQHKPVALIGFSTGGMLALGAKHNAPVLTICAPVYGTYSAYLWNTVGVKQLRPGSEYLRHVWDGVVDKKSVSSIFTYLDLTVIPYSNSKVGVTTGTLSILHDLTCFWPKTQRVVSDFIISL